MEMDGIHNCDHGVSWAFSPHWIAAGMLTRVFLPRFFFGAVGFLIVPETYAPVLLQRRAKKIRYETRNWAIHSRHDESQVDLRYIMQKFIARPFAMLFLEPILLLVTLYVSVPGFLADITGADVFRA